MSNAVHLGPALLCRISLRILAFWLLLCVLSLYTLILWLLCVTHNMCNRSPCLCACVSYLCTSWLCSLCVTHNMCNRSPCLAALVAQGCPWLVSVFFSRLIMYIIGPGGGLLQNAPCQWWVYYGENLNLGVKVSPMTVNKWSPEVTGFGYFFFIKKSFDFCPSTQILYVICKIALF